MEKCNITPWMTIIPPLLRSLEPIIHKKNLKEKSKLVTFVNISFKQKYV